MPLYPYGYEDKELSKVMVDLTEQEEEDRKNDYEEIKNSKEYRDKHKAKWILGGMSYNVLQEGTPNDRVSNIYIGLGRMIIDQGIATMSEGEPEFDYDPLGPSDGKKNILWKAAVKMVLSQCNYKSHQDKFLTDFHVFGPGVFEAYTQMPTRTIREENEDGSLTSRLVRDFRRSKVGVRHVSPFHCWRNPNVMDPDEVPSCGKEEFLTRNQFIQNYANSYIINGKGEQVPKYKNMTLALSQTGSHFKVTRQENEIGDSIRIYALAYGNKPEGTPEAVPEFELGIPIFDKPLKIKKIKTKDGWRSSGLNALGMTTLCFGANNDMYDEGYETHSLYGMGIPQLIEGPDMALQAFTNMNFDNMRLANTVAISYKPYDGKTYLDFDNAQFYSGMKVDGDIVATPFGQVKLSENSWMNEWLNETCISLTGVNFRQLVGDDMKTAFQAGLRVRQNNQRAMKRIKSLENGCFKRMGTLLLSNILSELTVEEWEDMTEEQVAAAASKISKNEATAEDYKELDGLKPKRRVQMYIPVEGKKYREDFNTTKKRKLDYNATDNTLIEDPQMPVDVSYVPMDKKYLYPVDDIESIIHFNTRVEGKHMLGDTKVQDMEMYEKLINMAVMLQQSGVLPDVDFKSLFSEVVKYVGADERKVFNSTDDKSKMLKIARDIQQQMETELTSPPPNAPMANPTPALPSAPAGGSPSPLSASGSGSGTPPQPPAVLQGVANGTI